MISNGSIGKVVRIQNLRTLVPKTKTLGKQTKIGKYEEITDVHSRRKTTIYVCTRGWMQGMPDYQ